MSIFRPNESQRNGGIGSEALFYDLLRTHYNNKMEQAPFFPESHDHTASLLFSNASQNPCVPARSSRTKRFYCLL